ncbi:phage tail protein [Pseudomonas mangiferae]|uniref:Phage tail protein n=1 Tax=Pseudomonas mangiferae TaxID=2593654 RepID=A0A553H0K2_9PSED|nr:phage tail protein [Pseudomonas mangiferae]TRX75272.1 phage tail protein [Pseudomonas mangiferae]
MNKPENLRAYLLGAIPTLRDTPNGLLLSVEDGQVRCTSAPSLSFEYRYTLRLTLAGYSGHPDTVIVPLLAWVRMQQSELLVNLSPEAQRIAFQVGSLDGDTVDLTVSLPLSERVVVARQDDGTPLITHAAEPAYEPYQSPTDVQVIAEGDVLLEWRSADTGDAMALAMPHPKPRRP